ncbi:hypothetical protein [Deinococcus aestuarii]|uniref:hypothetical protein n=1 Tax=Deinococcus aestuarii TaxID=2774531 RepID=UPI001C0BE368|nr:hypothetical protein [Deinococcus aestuarii]
MSQVDRPYSVVLQNFDLSPGNSAIVQNESYRVDLLRASNVFLKEPLVQALGDHEVVEKLQHLSQQPSLTTTDAADSLRCIEAVQVALHEAAHHAAAFAVTRAEDVLLKGVFLEQAVKEARAKSSKKVLKYFDVSAQLYVLTAPTAFEVLAKINFDKGTHVVGINAYRLDERDIEDLINTSHQSWLEDGNIYHEGERAYDRVCRLLQEHRAALEPAVVAGARLALSMLSEGRTSVAGDQLDDAMAPFLTRGQWSEIVLEDPEMPPRIRQIKVHERESARRGEPDVL